MSATREIITLQFGNYANFIGAHWWNIQESGFSYGSQTSPAEISHDVLYREGINLQHQTTYTPRLLLVDLSGSLKHLPQDGELYCKSIKRTAHTSKTHEAEESVKKLKEELEWKEADVEIVAQAQVSKSDFQMDLDNATVDLCEKDYKLAESVESWVDFLYARYHPRTVHVVQKYKCMPEKQTFDTYPSGVQLWKTPQFEEDFCDNIRQYVEECDYLQGFQMLFDCSNGYTGLATECLEHINDEYGKANFVIPVYEPRSVLFENADAPLSDSIRVVNSALAFNKLSEQASLFVPLSTNDCVWRQLGSSRSLRSLQYQGDNLYQTSAILAAYLDTITLSYRLKDAHRKSSLAGFCRNLSNYGRKLGAAAFSLPFAMQQHEDLIDCLDKFDGPLFTQLTPNCAIGTDYVIQSLCMRGIPIHRLKRPLEQAQQQMHMAAYKCTSGSEMLQLYLQCANHASLAHVTSIVTPMSTRIPFPTEIFADTLNKSGFRLPSDSKRDEGVKVHTVPTLASVQSSSALADMLETLHREARRVKIAKLHRYQLAGLEEDDYNDALEHLLLFKNNYEDNFEL